MKGGDSLLPGTMTCRGKTGMSWTSKPESSRLEKKSGFGQCSCGQNPPSLLLEHVVTRNELAHGGLQPCQGERHTAGAVGGNEEIGLAKGGKHRKASVFRSKSPSRQLQSLIARRLCRGSTGWRGLRFSPTGDTRRTRLPGHPKEGGGSRHAAKMRPQGIMRERQMPVQTAALGREHLSPDGRMTGYRDAGRNHFVGLRCHRPNPVHIHAAWHNLVTTKSNCRFPEGVAERRQRAAK